MLRDGLRDRDDRPPRPPRGRGHHGPGDARHAPGRDGRGRGAAASRATRRGSPTSRRPRCRSTTRAPIVAALKARFPGDPRAEEGRHLLRHAEPPGRGEVHGAAVRRGDRGRLAQQLQLQPPARGGASTWARRPTWWTAPPTCEPEWIAGKRRVGVTAGASAPRGAGGRADRAAEGARRARACARSTGITERVVFTLPRELARG